MQKVNVARHKERDSSMNWNESSRRIGVELNLERAEELADQDWEWGTEVGKA